MIYTLTCNPALDYVVKVEEFTLDEVNRASKEEIYYGGKGINVSTMLSNLGYESVALGYIAGFTGDAIEKGVKTLDFSSDFIKVKNGFSRINIKLKSTCETEINGIGPVITIDDINKLFEKLDLIKKEDILIISGSVPNTLGDGFYEDIMKRLEHKNIKIIVDATRNLLLNTLKYKPFLIKPNKQELEELFNVKLSNQEDVVIYAKKLQEMGAKNVLISMAKEGAILIDENKNILKVNAIKGEVKNSVGAGDSMIAGFIVGYESSKDYRHALRLSVASGSATAFSNGLATENEVINQLNLLY